LTPATLEMFTIEPRPAAFMVGTTAFMPRNGPIWLTPIETM
jgi:hypothetical protein